MGNKSLLTLVVAVYNAKRYLEYIFAALMRQSMREYEVIIADDGSGPEIGEFIEWSRSRLPFPLQHLWQPDSGFRKNIMLNKAIAASQTDYLVFIDGDCVPHHEFIYDHWLNRKPNHVLCGRRVNFSRSITDRLKLEDIVNGRHEKMSLRLLFDGLMARSSNLEEAIRIENSLLRRLLHRNRARILGCNFSIEKKLLERINGFNEDYQAPGLGEDTDIDLRLKLIGAQFITLRHLAVLYHLYHPPTQVGEENKRIIELVAASKDPICRNGLKKLP
jgi:cellulose synthase/poly-beta-1,6-N-acetylglucosamine synthase-like glycosyltransferase